MSHKDLSITECMEVQDRIKQKTIQIKEDALNKRILLLEKRMEAIERSLQCIVKK